jgi:hypothetical protein
MSGYAMDAMRRYRKITCQYSVLCADKEAEVLTKDSVQTKDLMTKKSQRGTKKCSRNSKNTKKGVNPEA